jgi:hypothetical protein
MATIVYLDAEDEITSAAARIRAAADSRVGIVLPFGSRVATSRINFRLLAREAMSHGRRLDIVAPDASARALAASAGLPVFASVGEYEAALDVEDDEKDARRAAFRAEAGLDKPSTADGAAAAAAGGAAAAAAAGPGPSTGPRSGARPRGGGPTRDTTDSALGDAAGEATVATAAAGTASTRKRSGTPAAGSASATVAATDLTDTDLYDAPGAVGASTPRTGGALPVVHARRRGRRLGVLVGALVVVAVVVGAVGVGAYLLLPSASITVTPRIEAIGPVTFTVRADPTTSTVDEDAAVVPATTITVPVQAEAEFPATGKRVERTPATGAVRWTNCDPTSAYTIPSGTLVRTASGIGFTTDEQLFLPVASLSGGGASPSLDCKTSEVSITAVEPGPDGNVGAGTIRVVPARYNREVVRVNNPDATSGGKREEFTRISQKDVQAALAKLDTDLRTAFEAEVQHPADVPEGTTPFPDTAQLGEPTPTVDPQTLVGQEVESFTLGLTADGTVLAADSSPAQAIAEQRLQASVAEGRELVPGSTDIEVGDGRVADGVIEFPVTATARQVRPLDAAALERAVLGLPLAQARDVLSPYGDVVIQPWPDWVTSVPSLEQRVILSVGEPVDGSGSPTESPSAGATDGGSATGPVPSGG